MEEGQTTQWPKQRIQTDKQCSTKHVTTQKYKDWAKQPPLKPRNELMCLGRVINLIWLLNIELFSLQLQSERMSALLNAHSTSCTIYEDLWSYFAVLTLLMIMIKLTRVTFIIVTTVVTVVAFPYFYAVGTKIVTSVPSRCYA